MTNFLFFRQMIVQILHHRIVSVDQEILAVVGQQVKTVSVTFSLFHFVSLYACIVDILGLCDANNDLFYLVLILKIYYLKYFSVERNENLRNSDI